MLTLSYDASHSALWQYEDAERKTNSDDGCVKRCRIELLDAGNEHTVKVTRAQMNSARGASGCAGLCRIFNGGLGARNAR